MSAGLLWLSAIGLAGFPLSAQDPSFRNVYKLDAEYELDRFMGDFDWKARDDFAGSPTAYRATGGSLNIRHLYVRQDLKARFPLLQDRLWFRFGYERLEGLERDETRVPLEFEYSPFRKWFFSFIGEPAFHKSDTSAGAAARWGGAEGRSIKFTYLWPGFDANYAFRNTSVNEGFQEFYRRYPQEARLKAAWIKGPVSLLAEGRLARPWELDHRDLLSPPSSHIRRGAAAEAVLDFRWKRGVWVWSVEGETWKERESIAFEPAAPARDRQVRQERSSARLSIERSLGPRWRVRGGGGPVHSRGRLRHPSLTSADEGYKMLDRLAYLTAYYSRSPRSEWELGHVYDLQRFEVREPGGAGSGRRSHNRGRIGFRWTFNERAWLRLIGALELDRNQSERFGSFDGGTVQFQTFL